MDGDHQGRGGREACIASKPLIPTEPPMRSLGSGEYWRASRHGALVCGTGSHRHRNRFAPHALPPSASDLRAWPVSPKDGAKRGRLRRLWSRLRHRGLGSGGNRFEGRDGPANRAHPSWFAGGKAVLTLGSQLAGAAIADAGCIQQPVGAIALRPAFLWGERMIGGTEQGPIGLKRKS